MKIAFIINSLGGGGAERVLQTLSNYLVNHEHDITIIVLEQEKPYYILDEKIKIVTLRSSIFAKGIGKIPFIPLQSFELNRLLKKLEIEQAISFLVRANFVFCFTKYFSSSKVIISERIHAKKQYEKDKLENKIMNSLIRSLYKKADKIISISNGIRESLINDYSIDSSKIVTIHNPQNIEQIQTQKKKDISFKFNEKFKYFITLGRLVRQKDHATLIKAFKLCNEKFKDSKLLILGQGSLKDDTEKLIQELQLENKVILLGFIENPFDYLKKSDVFVFSSIFEGFGNVLVEAMACGLPVISTNCPSGPSEILENGKYGMLTKVGDEAELAHAMLEMLDDNMNKKFKTLSLERVLNFDVSIVANKYLDILKSTEA